MEFYHLYYYTIKKNARSVRKKLYEPNFDSINSIAKIYFNQTFN